MAIKTATLTHKVRNPQNLDLWLNIWEANVSADYDNNNNRNDESIIVKPSENWQIPISNLIDNGNNSPLPGTIGVNQVTPYTYADPITSSNWTTYNVTTTEGTQNHLAQFGTNGTITDGPEIKPINGNENKFLNEKGNWTTALTSISGEAGITVDGTTVKHSNTEIVSGTAGTNSTTFGTTIIEIPYITYDNYGHITAAGTHLHNLEGFLTSGGSEPINGSRIIGSNSLSVSVINSNGLNDTIRSKLNTQTEAGVVAAGNSGLSSVWSTDDSGNPSWNKITNDLIDDNAAIDGSKIADNSIGADQLNETAYQKFNTRLLGTVISQNQPVNILEYNQSSIDSSNELNNWDYEHCGIWVEI